MRRRWLGFPLGLVVLAAALPAGSARADSAYSVKIEAPAAKKGAPGKALIHVTPATGYHMNKEYPTSLALSAASGVALSKAKLTAADKEQVKLEEKGADIEVRFVASEAGSKAFEAELKFAVCSANSCDPKKEKLRFAVDVK